MEGKRVAEHLTKLRKDTDDLGTAERALTARLETWDESVVKNLEAGWKHSDIARITDRTVPQIIAAQRRFRERMALLVFEQEAEEEKSPASA